MQKHEVFECKTRQRKAFDCRLREEDQLVTDKPSNCAYCFYGNRELRRDVHVVQHIVFCSAHYLLLINPRQRRIEQDLMG